MSSISIALFFEGKERAFLLRRFFKLNYILITVFTNCGKGSKA
jgi:hypothetical protein